MERPRGWTCIRGYTPAPLLAPPSNRTTRHVHVADDGNAGARRLNQVLSNGIEETDIGRIRRKQGFLLFGMIVALPIDVCGTTDQSQW